MMEKRAADAERMDSLTFFEEQKRKNKETFNDAIEIFKNRDSGRRRGQVEFILVRQTLGGFIAIPKRSDFFA